jgi:tRNA A58 N-methylase Trm61
MGKEGKEWEQQLLKDFCNNKLYGVFLRTGRHYLKELNTQTGEICSVFLINYRYPEKIKVHNGFVYYIYRPFESTQTRFLYKEPVITNP